MKPDAPTNRALLSFSEISFREKDLPIWSVTSDVVLTVCYSQKLHDTYIGYIYINIVGT